MKAYTGRGDQGKTQLYNGERVPKSHPRVEAYGDIDELNSVLGALMSTLPENKGDLQAQIEHIQSLLFVSGTWLATTPDSPEMGTVDSIPESETKMLEQVIDSMDDESPRLRGFLLPGGHISAALTHIARTVCRRAERHVRAPGCGIGRRESTYRIHGAAYVSKPPFCIPVCTCPVFELAA